MLYTTYLRNIDKIPVNGVTTYFIARYLPGGFKSETHRLFHRPELSPPADLLRYYKDEIISWDEFERKFKRHMENNSEMQFKLNQMLEAMKQGQDFCLVCYEKDTTQCHRRLIAEWFKERGIQWKEI